MNKPDKKNMRFFLFVYFVIICILLCACDSTDRLKGTWEIDGAYYQESGMMERLETIRNNGDNTKVSISFDGQGTYEMNFTDSKGEIKSYSGTYRLPEDGTKLIVDTDNDQLTMMYYANVATFKDKHDSFVLVRTEGTSVGSTDSERFYLLRRTN